MSENIGAGYRSEAGWRRTPAPEKGHGQLTREAVNQFDREGQLNGIGRSAVDRFNSRFGGLFTGR